jgi:hypothetical protein
MYSNINDEDRRRFKTISNVDQRSDDQDMLQHPTVIAGNLIPSEEEC